MFFFADQWSSWSSCRCQVIYQAWHQERVQQTLYMRRRWMKDDISYEIWLIRVSRDALWSHQCIDFLSNLYESDSVWISQHHLSCLSEWHSDIQQNLQETCSSHTTNSWQTADFKALHQALQMQILQERVILSKI